MDWAARHHQYLQSWENRVHVDPDTLDPYDQAAYDEYLRWVHRSLRIHIRPPYCDDPLDDEIDEEDTVHDHDVSTRLGNQPERAPIQTYVVKYSLSCFVPMHLLQHLLTFSP